MPFTPLRQILQSVLKEHHLSADIDAYKVFSLWPEVTGEKVAAHARPARLSGTTLYVETDDPLWLAQLKYMKGDILKKLNERIKAGTFSDLKFFLKGL